VGIVKEPIADRIGDRGLADVIMPASRSKKFSRCSN
jgi:hypothetical protein